MIEILFCSSLFLLTLYYMFIRREVCNIPGPKGLPLYRSIMKMDLKVLYLKLYEWTGQYGEIYQFSLFGTKYICLNSSEIIREACSKEPNATHLSSRPPTFYGRYLLDNYSDVVFSPFSKEWVKRRKLFYQLLHAYGQGMIHIEQQISSQMKEVIERITKQAGLPVDPQCIVEDFILSNVEILVVGKRGKRSQELHKMLKKLNDDGNEFVNLGIDILYNFFPFLRFFPFRLSRLIRGYKKQMCEIVDILKKIALLKVRDESDSSGSKWFTDANMKFLLINVLGGAYITTRGTLMSAILLLAKRPDVQEKIQKELKEMTDERQILSSNREECPYLEAVILETLRFISHVPISLRYASADCGLKEYSIPKSSTIMINLWTAHHSKIWGDPFVFRPERFLSESGKLLPATHSVRKRLIVFGHGKRSCIGENFARTRIYMFLANILKNFTIHETDDSPELDPTDMVKGVVLQPKPYKVIFQRHNN